VLLAELYGTDVRAASQAEGSAAARKLREDPARWQARLGARLSTLRNHAAIARERVGAFGFCFGGACALELARSGAELRGVVSLHGTLATSAPAEAETLRASVFVMHGAEDFFREVCA
jgi:dienelactone hydrolase